MDKEALKQAIVYLISSPEYVANRREILSLVTQTHLQFAGEMEVLNSLVMLGRKSDAALLNVFDLVERKRKGVPDARRVDYQRDYMRLRRERMRKAARLEEIVRGKQMEREERDAYMAAVWADWMKKRDDVVGKHPDADWKERNRIVGEFWAGVDKQLDNDLAEANKVLSAPGHRLKRKVEVTKPKQTALRQAFEKARKK